MGADSRANGRDGRSEDVELAKPIVYDLYCGLGGWAEGFLAEGYRVVGFDIERHDYGTGGYPGELVLQDIRTLHGAQLRDAAVIVASSPCQEFSYRAMPWKRAKALGPPVLGIDLFYQSIRIQYEAQEAAGRPIPLIMENVKGAQPWIGRAAWHYGSFYLWGDVPALMPHGRPKPKRALDDVRHGTRATRLDGHTLTMADGSTRPPIDGMKGEGGAWFNDCKTRKLRGGNIARLSCNSSKSPARKAASAQIAKIPFPLAQHIARVFKPEAAK